MKSIKILPFQKKWYKWKNKNLTKSGSAITLYDKAFPVDLIHHIKIETNIFACVVHTETLLHWEKNIYGLHLEWKVSHSLNS